MTMTVYERPGQCPGEGSGKSLHPGPQHGAAAGGLAWAGLGGTNEGVLRPVGDGHLQPVGPGLHQVGGEQETVDSITPGEVWL